MLEDEEMEKIEAEQAPDVVRASWPSSHVHESSNKFIGLLSAIRLRYYIYGVYTYILKDLLVGPKVEIRASGIFVHGTDTEITWTDGAVSFRSVPVLEERSERIQGINFVIRGNIVVIEGLVQVTVTSDGRTVETIDVIADHSFENPLKIKGARSYYRTDHGKRVKQFILASHGGVDTFSHSIHIGAVNEGMLFKMRSGVELPDAEISLLLDLYRAIRDYHGMSQAILRISDEDESLTTQVFDGIVEIPESPEEVPCSDIVALHKFIQGFLQSRISREPRLTKTSKLVLEKIKSMHLAITDAIYAYNNAVCLAFSVASSIQDRVENEVMPSIFQIVSSWTVIPPPLLADNAELTTRGYYPITFRGDNTFKFPTYSPVTLVQDKFVLNPELEDPWGELMNGISGKNYRIIATIGKQSSGKSTMQYSSLSIPFGTKISTRFAETIGISIGRSPLQNPAAPFAVLALDGEGLLGTDVEDRIHDVETTRMKNMLLCLCLSDLFVFRLSYSDLHTSEHTFVGIEKVLGVMSRNLEGLKRTCRIIFVFQDYDSQVVDDPNQILAKHLSKMTAVTSNPEMFHFSTFCFPNPNIDMIGYLKAAHDFSALIHYNANGMFGGETTVGISELRSHIGRTVRVINESPDIMKQVRAVSLGMLEQLSRMSTFLEELKTLLTVDDEIDVSEIEDINEYVEDYIRKLNALIERILGKFIKQLDAESYITIPHTFGEVDKGSIKEEIIGHYKNLLKDLIELKKIRLQKMLNLVLGHFSRKINKARNLRDALEPIIQALTAIHSFMELRVDRLDAQNLLFMKGRVDHFWKDIKAKMSELLGAFTKSSDYKDLVNSLRTDDSTKQASVAFKRAIGILEDFGAGMHEDVRTHHSNHLEDAFSDFISEENLNNLFQVTVNLLKDKIGEADAVKIAITVLSAIVGERHSAKIILKGQKWEQNMKKIGFERATIAAVAYTAIWFIVGDWLSIIAAFAMFVDKWVLGIFVFYWYFGTTYLILGMLVAAIFTFNRYKSKTSDQILLAIVQIVSSVFSVEGKGFKLVKVADQLTIMWTSGIVLASAALSWMNHGTRLGGFFGEYSSYSTEKQMNPPQTSGHNDTIPLNSQNTSQNLTTNSSS